MIGAARALLVAVALAIAVWPPVAKAQPPERILDYRVQVYVLANGNLDVVERIRVRAMGSQIRRGIYRDFPTRYEDRFGNEVVVDLTVLAVERDGQQEPWFTERLDNGVRINTGSDAFLAVPADYEYTLRYRTSRQLGFFADHDELYWNAIGTGWDFWIDQGSVEVELPAAVPIESMHAEGYTGYQGTKGQDYRADLPGPGRAHFVMMRPLANREGLTIVLTFPKGIVAEPTDEQRLRWFLKDNRGVLVALIGLVVLIAFCMFEWRRVGRDPHKGVIIPRYEPPPDHTPAGLRYVRRMGYDMRCFSAEVLSLAVAGRLRIEREDRLLRDEWRLEAQSSDGGAKLAPAQRALLDGIFADGKQSLVLQNTNARHVSRARAAHEKVLDEQNHPRYFELNRKSSLIAAAIAIVAGGIAVWTSNGFGIPAIVVVVVLMIVTLIVFGFLVRAPTRAGRKLLDEIEGFTLYLSVAERQELAGMKGPDGPAPLDAARYEQLLPFAVALEVEDAWTEKFTAAVGAAAAAATAAGISWYRGGALNNLGDLTSAVGNSLSSTISSAATPPGSSSGSGGGGSSGGGGGGGGGGGR